jgi:hypothetical protein
MSQEGKRYSKCILAKSIATYALSFLFWNCFCSQNMVWMSGFLLFSLLTTVVMGVVLQMAVATLELTLLESDRLAGWSSNLIFLS